VASKGRGARRSSLLTCGSSNKPRRVHHWPFKLSCRSMSRSVPSCCRLRTAGDVPGHPPFRYVRITDTAWMSAIPHLRGRAARASDRTVRNKQRPARFCLGRSKLERPREELIGRRCLGVGGASTTSTWPLCRPTARRPYYGRRRLEIARQSPGIAARGLESCASQGCLYLRIGVRRGMTVRALWVRDARHVEYCP